MCCGVPIRINTHTSLSCLEEDLLGDSLVEMILDLPCHRLYGQIKRVFLIISQSLFQFLTL